MSKENKGTDSTTPAFMVYIRTKNTSGGHTRAGWIGHDGLGIARWFHDEGSGWLPKSLTALPRSSGQIIVSVNEFNSWRRMLPAYAEPA